MATGEEVRVALVGCGDISTQHLKAFDELGLHLIRCTACVDINPTNRNRVAAATGAPTFDSLDSFLAADTAASANGGSGLCDAIALLLPHHLHHDFTCRVLQETNKHLFVEKPLDVTADKVASIMKIAEERAPRGGSRVFYVGENSQYWPEVVKAKELIETGAIGTLLTGRAVYSEGVADSPFSEGYEGGTWRDDPALSGGGVVMDGGSHWLRPLRLFFGDPEAVVATMAPGLLRAPTESIANALIRFKSGYTATYTCVVSEGHVSNAPWFVLTGTKGEITITGDFQGGMTVFNADTPKGGIPMEPMGYNASFPPQWRDFIKAVKTGEETKGTPRDAVVDISTLLAMYRSVKSGKWEPVECA